MRYVKATLKSLTKENTHLLLVVSCLLNANPANGLDNSLINMFQRFRPLPSYLNFLADPLQNAIISLILWFGLRNFKMSIRRPAVAIIIMHLVFILAVVQLLTFFFVPCKYAWFASYVLFEVVTNLGISVCLVVCAQQISKYCQEGYEGFSINLISGSINIAIISGTYVGRNLVGNYLSASHYRQTGFIYSIILCIEVAVIPLLLAFYFFKVRS